jgi:hypothetical protein
MQALRSLLRDYRRVTFALIVLVLAMKALVPAGYMVGSQGKVLTIHICADAAATQLTKQIVVPLTGDDQSAQEHGKADSVCPFAALTTASLAGADAILLALALAFIFVAEFAAVRPAQLRRSFHLRPPLRGPPVSR